MCNQSGTTACLVEQLGEFGEDARNRLISHAVDRLRRLARQMLKGFPGVREMAQTDDVLDQAVLRLIQALRRVRPKCACHFWRLSAQHIRWELLDLARQRSGLKSLSDGNVRVEEDLDELLSSVPAPDEEPVQLESWARFHELIQKLPEKEREVVELLWYQGLNQKQTAEVLGVSLHVVRHRWLSARLKLARWLSDGPPR